MLKQLTTRRAEGGFSLVEIIVGLVVLGVLAVIAIPTYNYRQSQIEDKKLQEDVKSIAALADIQLKANPTMDLFKEQFNFSPSSSSLVWNIAGNARIGYCITAKNEKSSKHKLDATALTYDSVAGGFNKDSGACLAVKLPNAVAEPVEVASNAPSGHTWLSGVNGIGAENGEFAAWRASAIDIVGVEDASDLSQTNIKLPEDISITPFAFDGSWSAAANGAYDMQWRDELYALSKKRSGQETFLRFAPEMNVYWRSWRVNDNEAADFVQAWKRYREIQKEVFPEAKLVFNVNNQTNGINVDWRTLLPGFKEKNVKNYVDLMSVDYYNDWTFTSTQSDFITQSTKVDSFGAPQGIESHRVFAQSVGLPFAISQWSSNAQKGDSPEFIKAMKNFISQNAGSGAGKIKYEIFYNGAESDKRWLIYGEGIRMPATAIAYQDAF